MSGKKTLLCCVTAILLVAVALPAAASANNRIILCLQGKAACSGTNRVDVPKQVSDAVVPLLVGKHGGNQEHLWTALYYCSGITASLNASLQQNGIDAEVCEEDGHWSFGYTYRTRLGKVVRVECSLPRPSNTGEQSYRGCVMEGAPPNGPFLVIEENRNWPYPPVP
jgi:hypothetical protein